MSIAGFRVIRSDGRQGVLTTGERALFGTTGTCPACCDCTIESCNMQSIMFDGYEAYHPWINIPPLANLSCEEVSPGVFSWFFQALDWIDVGENPDCPGTMDRELFIREATLIYDTTVDPHTVTLNYEMRLYLYAWEGPEPCVESETPSEPVTGTATGTLAALGIELIEEGNVCQFAWTVAPGTTPLTKPIPEPPWPPE